MPDLQMRQDPEQSNLLLIIEDIAELKEIVQSLKGAIGDVNILIVGDGKAPGLAELFRALNTKLDNHIIVEEQSRKDIRVELLKYREAMEEAAATELAAYRAEHEIEVKRALKRGVLTSGGGAAIVIAVLEFLRSPWVSR